MRPILPQRSKPRLILSKLSPEVSEGSPYAQSLISYLAHKGFLCVSIAFAVGSITLGKVSFRAA